MALAGAAMQQVMCMEMMRQAQETGDSTMMMMGMQMCAQAAQNAANAAQNKEGSNKLTTPTGGAQGNSLAIKEATIDTQPKTDDFDLNGLLKNAEAKSSEIKLADNPKVTFQTDQNNTDSSPNFNNEKIEESDSKGSNPLAIAQPGNAKSSEVTLGQSSTGGQPSPAGNLGVLNPAPSAESKLNLSSKANASEATDDSNRKNLKKNTGSKMGEAGTGASAESPNRSAYDDLMARMANGGAQTGIASAGLGGGFIDLAQGLQQGSRSLNIFEYASVQYQKAKTHGLGQVPKTQSLYPSRELASEN
jgi:hypothetical protein